MTRASLPATARTSHLPAGPRRELHVLRARTDLRARIGLGARARLVFAILLAIAWFAGIGSRVLLQTDEGRYAEIAREMAVSGDWVTPRLDGLKYLEKPPLQFWVTAATFRAVGATEGSARFWPALAGLATIAVLGFAATRLAGASVGWLAAMAFAAMPLPTAMARFLTVDAMLQFWLAAALAAFLIAQHERTSRTGARAWMLVAWAAAAGAVLTKGLVGIAIPGASLVLYSLVTGDRAVWRRLHIGAGLALFLVLTVPWFFEVSRANPEFARFFFVREHVERYLTTVHRREGPWWYFVPVLAAGLLPWAVIGARALPGAWRDAVPGPHGFSWQRFCLVWAAFVFVFFSVSESKLASYILPLFPALVLPLGWQLARLPAKSLSRGLLPLAVAGFAFFVAATLAWPVLADRLPENQAVRDAVASMQPSVVAAAAIALVAVVVAMVALRRGTAGARAFAVAALALGTVLSVGAAFQARDAMRVTRSSFDLLAAARRAEGPAFDGSAPFFQVHGYDQTLPFYLGKPTPLVAFEDELVVGLEAEPGKGYPTDAAWIAEWKSLSQGYALLRAPDAARFAAGGLPMREIARVGGRVIVARR